MADFWLAWHGLATDPKWPLVAKIAKVATGTVLAVAVTLFERASQAGERGSFAGFHAESIAHFLGYKPEQVERVVSAMREVGIAVGDRFAAWGRRQQENVVRPKQWHEHETEISRKEASAASTERVRRHRERKEARAAQPRLPLDGAPVKRSETHETLVKRDETHETRFNVSSVVSPPTPPKNIITQDTTQSVGQSDRQTDDFEIGLRKAINANGAPDLFKPSAVESLRTKVGDCDLEQDILPAVAEFAAKAKGGLRKLDNAPLVESIHARARERISGSSKPRAPSLRRQVFVEVGTPEWDAWKAFRKECGRPLPDEHRVVDGQLKNGWWLPTRWPHAEGSPAEPVPSRARSPPFQDQCATGN